MTPLFWVPSNLIQKEIQISAESAISHHPTSVRFQTSRRSFILLEKIALYNRINTLSAIFNAKRGWVGASLSISEILTALYFELADFNSNDPNSKDLILLSKGHAAAMQYACLYGRGILSLDDLKKLNQPGGPQAHPDIQTPGIAANSGSLGQTLSKACGLAMGQNRNVFVILGDGELQEGQNWEAFQTIHRYGLANVIPIIDKNGIQTDSDVADIKPISDLKKVLEGFGLSVLSVEGNRMDSIYPALKQAIEGDHPTVVIANTRKAAGIPFMEADHTERRGFLWHGPITEEKEYLAALEALASRPEATEIRDAMRQFLKSRNSSRVSVPLQKEKPLSTGDAFGRALVAVAPEYPNLVVLDADLEKACRLTEFAKHHPAQFLEMGIAEQDMVSVAGGLALAGKIPIVNTYASFFRRAFEQITMNATEKTRVIYVGHYAGLCYFADGKSHQATGDVAMMRSIPGMLVLYPAFPEEVEPMLRWMLNGGWNGPVYIRLHRTPAESSVVSVSSYRLGQGVLIKKSGDGKPETGNRICLVTSGPHTSSFCVQASEILEKRGVSCDVISFPTLRPIDPGYLRKVFPKYPRIFIAEELYETGGLFDEIQHGFAEIVAQKTAIHFPLVYHFAVFEFTFSTPDSFDLYRHARLLPDDIVAWVLKTI